MKKLIYKIKRWFRKKYILYKYKKNGLVYLKSTDRQFGLSTILMQESIRNNIPIYVPNENAKKFMLNEMYSLMYSPYFTSTYTLSSLVISPSDVGKRGRRFDTILIDNQCSDSDVDRLCEYLGYGVKLKGFITVYDD